MLRSSAIRITRWRKPTGNRISKFLWRHYRKFLNGEYGDVIRRKSEADIQFPQSILTPKFDFLKTLSIGKTQPVPAFEASLNDIVRTYGSDPVKDEAQNILDYLHNSGSKTPEPEPADTVQQVKLLRTLPIPHIMLWSSSVL